MKTCLLCSTPATDEPTCLDCGEASWSDPSDEPDSQDEMATQPDSPRAKRGRK